jgi:predicted metal-dependent phosphoesterase TrpH
MKTKTTLKQRILKADLHIHTAHSGDSDISAWDIIEQARANDLDVVGVTDHHAVKGGIETTQLAAKEFPGLIVLVGQEVKTKSGEIIVFGLGKDIPRKKSLTETCKLARKSGGFIVIPHPFDRLRGGIGGRIRDIVPYIDAVEVLNSKSIWKRFNKKARDFAKRHRLAMIAGSDAHIPQYIGACYTLVETESGKQEPTERDIFSAIKAGKTVCSGNVVGLRGACLLVRMKRIARKLRRA